MRNTAKKLLTPEFAEITQNPAARAPERATIEETVAEIIARGSEAEIRTCKEGLKVIEVSRKIIKIFPAADAEREERTEQ